MLRWKACVKMEGLCLDGGSVLKPPLLWRSRYGPSSSAALTFCFRTGGLFWSHAIYYGTSRPGAASCLRCPLQRAALRSVNTGHVRKTNDRVPFDNNHRHGRGNERTFEAEFFARIVSNIVTGGSDREGAFLSRNTSAGTPSRRRSMRGRDELNTMAKY